MAIYPDKLGASVTGEPFSWSSDDAALYALSVGVSEDGATRLPFTTSGSAEVRQPVLPTFAVILAMKSQSSPLKLAGDFPLSRIIHAGQRVMLNEPLASQGDAVGTTEITGVYDTGKHALIETTTRLTALGSGIEFARTVSTVLVLGEGGFGGAKTPSRPRVPAGAPHGTLTHGTNANQALVYRLNGDHNPLHFDPKVAEKLGFQRPILHGLCTFGIISQSLLLDACNDNPARFDSFSARFSRPVYPGAVLETRWWREESKIIFQTTANQEVVLDSGVFRLR